MDHLRIMDDGRIGLYQGPFCPRCGESCPGYWGHFQPKTNDYSCTPNPKLAAELSEVNQFGEEVIGMHYSDLIDKSNYIRRY